MERGERILILGGISEIAGNAARENKHLTHCLPECASLFRLLGHLLPTGGVDTHRDLHVVAALDERGGLLDTNTFPATAAGYHDLVVWLSCFGPIERVGVEGTGTYGAGLGRHLLDHGIEVIEVDRPNRQRRRRAGKSDTTDAVSAARAALSGEASTSAKTRDGNVENLRVLRVARRSTRQDRVRALTQLR